MVREIAVASVFIQREFQRASLHLSSRLASTLFVSRSSRIRERRFRRAKRGKSAWSTYLERLNIYKQWPDGFPGGSKWIRYASSLACANLTNDTF